ncbi:hypothetical protein NW767_012537 [Fusarium falciforme]|nr:hypothetical protein NW767_012537 [Fusarium falciforme]
MPLCLGDETEKTVIKGNFSSCEEQVEITASTSDETMDRLRCTRPSDNTESSTQRRSTKKYSKAPQKATKKSPAIQEYDRHYFHQEFIGPL